MTPTKDQQAQEYANSFIGSTEKAIRKSAWLDGYTAAEQSMWRSVEEELPEDDTLAVVHSPNGRVEVLHYYDDAFQDELKQAHCVDYWMALPEIPSLNPEQR